tara:strand:+ start:4650 stop:5165 length:516 start_codon:yes stop_codon:yes gene_type:complete
MDKILKNIDKTLGWVMVVLMAILVIDVVWQVTTRYVLGSASSFTEEIARYLLIWIGLLGSAFAYRKNLHLAFDYFSEKVTGRRKKWLGYFIHSLIALFSFLVLVVGGSYLVQLTWELNQVSAALQIKLAYVYSVLPLSGALIILYAIAFIMDIYRGRVQQTPPESKSVEAV